MNRIQELIDKRRDLEAQVHGVSIEIAMALGLPGEAHKHRKLMEATVTARKAARESGCYFAEQGEADRGAMGEPARA